MRRQAAPIEGVFFDLDGTLMDTADDFVTVVNQLAAEHGQPPLMKEAIRRQVSAGARALVSLALGVAVAHPAVELNRQRLLDYYADHIRRPDRPKPATVYPGIHALLADLEARSIAWGIVTNKPAALAMPLLQQVQLYHRASTLVCPDHVRLPKPDPQSLLLACQQARCTPARSFYIGDHKRDMAAGNQAGMTTVAALYGYIADADEPASWQADLQADSVAMLHAWFIDQQWQVPA